MPNVDVSLEVPADLEKAWSVVSDFSRFEEWLTIHAGWVSEPPADPTQVTVGTKLTQRVKVLGMVNNIQWVVEEYEPLTRLRLTGLGLANVKVALSAAVEPGEDGKTVAKVSAEYTGDLVTGPIAEAIEKDAMRNLDESMAKLNALLG